MTQPATNQPSTNQPDGAAAAEQPEQPEAPEAPQTGDQRVDDALRGVADLDDSPVDEHAERLADAHGALQEVLRQPSEPHP